jgi:Ca2+-binding EF-hand superfamily protein
LRASILLAAAFACGAGLASPPPPVSPIGDEEQWLLDADADHDGRIQRSEYENFLNAKFDSFDLNHDGRFTKNEFDNSDLDTDKNGVISRSEYLTANMAEFANYDSNHDGYLTLGEERQFVADTALSTVDIDKMIDLDRDGVMTRQEFNAYWKARFQILDRNRDQQLSGGEVQDGGSPYWATVVKSLDRNGDGFITYDEYMSYYGYRFVTADKDKDGRLPVNETW